MIAIHEIAQLLGRQVCQLQVENVRDFFLVSKAANVTLSNKS